MVCPSLKQEWGRPDLQQAWSIQKWMGKMGRPSLKQRWSTAGLRQKIGRPAFVREAVTEMERSSLERDRSSAKLQPRPPQQL